MGEEHILEREEVVRIQAHEPNGDLPPGYRHFGAIYCNACGKPLTKYREAGRGGIYSCIDGVHAVFQAEWNHTQSPSDCQDNWSVYINRCCSCARMIDSRYCQYDEKAKRYRCAVCGAKCEDESPDEKSEAREALADRAEELAFDAMLGDTCSWCGNTGIAYREEYLALCRSCHNQYFD